MNNYCILTDSSCDLSQEMADELELRAVPLSVNYKGQDYRNYLDGRTLDIRELYAGLRAGEMTVTTAVNPQQWKEEMEPILQEGTDILVLAFSSGLSATYSTACIAAEELKKKYPERKLYVVDTLCASLGEGLIDWYAVGKKRAGLSIEELRDEMERMKLQVCHWFTVDDLHFLKRGGRISGAAAAVGSLLQIKPVLHVDNEGKLIPMAKARGRRASLQMLADKVKELGTDVEHQTIFISHGDCLEDAEYLARLLREQCHPADVVINFIGPVIGSHAGPGTVAMFFLGKER